MNPSELVIHLERPMDQLSNEGPPAREVVIAALKWPTGYWAELALTWLEAGLPVDKEIADLLLAASGQRAFSQRLRHRAFAMAIGWERKNRSS